MATPSKELASGSSDQQSRNLFIHPLAIATICDHHTRVSVGGTQLGSNDPVIGLLLGFQSGLDVHIIDGTDAVYEIDEKGEIKLDMEANFPNPADPENKNNKLDLVIEPFASINYELIGWYAVCDGLVPPKWCLNIQKKIQKVNEAPLFLLMNHSPDPNSKLLPLAIFESEAHSGNDNFVSEVFVNLPFRLETTQMEKITVDQITKQGPMDGVSAAEVQNQTLVTSLTILKEKIRVIISALEKMVQSGNIDNNLVRRANQICQQLPAIDSTKFNDFYQNEFMNCMMTNYLGAAAKSSSAVLELNEMYTKIYNQHGGMRGGLD